MHCFVFNSSIPESPLRSSRSKRLGALWSCIPIRRTSWCNWFHAGAVAARRAVVRALESSSRALRGLHIPAYSARATEISDDVHHEDHPDWRPVILRPRQTYFNNNECHLVQWSFTHIISFCIYSYYLNNGVVEKTGALLPPPCLPSRRVFATSSAPNCTWFFCVRTKTYHIVDEFYIVLV